LKTTFLALLVIAIGRSCFADTNGWQISGITYPNPVLVVTASNLPSVETLNAFYIGAAKGYDRHPEHYRLDQLFAVARGYFLQTNCNKAIAAYIGYLRLEPTNTVAIRELGICFVYNQEYDEAESQFHEGWHLGDDYALEDLANLYFMTSRFSRIKPLVPDLLKAREREVDKGSRHEITNDLIACSLNAKPSADKEVFLKAIDGLSDEFILEREDTAQFVILGLKTFGYQERADKLTAAMKKAN
jgi:hypothetical protein